jgi:SEC-C motif domain protein
VENLNDPDNVNDPNKATVEFVARFKIGGGRAERLHEISRFVREEGRWFYVDGKILGD